MLRLLGDLNLNGFTATMEPDAVIQVSGVISGAGAGSRVTVSGSGTLRHNGTNTYAGVTTVNAGTLEVNGVISNVTLSGSGTLAGDGVVGNVTMSGTPTISPGNSAGILTVAGALTLNSAATVVIELNGEAPGTGHDQLNVLGSVTLSSAALNASLNFASALSNQFVIIVNDGSDPVMGTFNSLPENSTFAIGSEQFRISYAGGDGNDVELTQATGYFPPAIPLSSGTYTQDFNSLATNGAANSWSNNPALRGWHAAQSASPFTVTTYRASNGSENNGALYSFGASNTNERAWGSIASGATGTNGLGVCFTNDTANSLSNFTITYTGEQWRNGDGAVTNMLTFWYRVSASALTNPEPANVTDWTPVSNLNFVSPTVLATGTPLNGNASTNRRAFLAVIIPGLVVAPGQTVFFRWVDINDGGADQGMAVDDLIVAFSLPPSDRFWTNAVGGNYEVAANWLDNVVPQPQDNAHFTNNSSYQVSWFADALAANAYFNAASGAVTQAIGAASWTLSNSYVVGRDSVATAAVTHISGALHVTNSAGTARLVIGETGQGTYNLSGGVVVTDHLIVTNGSVSRFTFSAGILRTRNTEVGFGSIFTLGAVAGRCWSWSEREPISLAASSLSLLALRSWATARSSVII